MKTFELHYPMIQFLIIEGFGGKRALGFLLKSELCQKLSRLKAVSLLSSVSHVRERASSGKAVRREKRGQQPKKIKERLPAQPEPMKYALASQHKNTIGWCVKRWQQTVNNQNHWQVDNFFHNNTTFESWFLPASTLSPITWSCNIQISRRFKHMKWFPFAPLCMLS